MGFVKRIQKKHSQTGAKLFVYDYTLDYEQNDDYGWGKGDTPIDREDYYLLCFVKYIDKISQESYLDHENQYPSVNDKKFGLADGTGLANTDQSVFTILTPNDGHHIIYLTHLEKKTTQSSGSLGDVYYNTDDSKPYYHNGTAFVEITQSNLSSLESLSVTKACGYMFDIRARIWLNEKRLEAYEPGKARNEMLIILIRDVKNLLSMVFANFQTNAPASRVLMNKVIDIVND